MLPTLSSPRAIQQRAQLKKKGNTIHACMVYSERLFQGKKKGSQCRRKTEVLPARFWLQDVFLLQPFSVLLSGMISNLQGNVLWRCKWHRENMSPPANPWVRQASTLAIHPAICLTPLQQGWCAAAGRHRNPALLSRGPFQVVSRSPIFLCSQKCLPI